jgi:hypothetical protein
MWLLDVRCFTWHCTRNMFTTFTEVAGFFLTTSQFLAPLAPVIDSGAISPKSFGGATPQPQIPTVCCQIYLPSLLIFFFFFPSFPSSSMLHFIFHYILGADFLNMSHEARFHYPPPSLPFLPFITEWFGSTNLGKFLNFQTHIGEFSRIFGYKIQHFDAL